MYKLGTAIMIMMKCGLLHLASKASHVIDIVFLMFEIPYTESRLDTCKLSVFPAIHALSLLTMQAAFYPGMQPDLKYSCWIEH